jgi:hypothetical protein
MRAPCCPLLICFGPLSSHWSVLKPARQYLDSFNQGVHLVFQPTDPLFHT